MTDLLSEQQWWDYEQLGYLRLGSILYGPELTALQRRMDEVIVGQVRDRASEFQLDTGGRSEGVLYPVPHARTTVADRTARGVETDPLVLEVIRRPVFREICGRHYGKHARISVFRAMLMTTAAGTGTYLPWHQDDGEVWKLDRDPLVTIWVALDAANRTNGCVEVIPGTHRLGLLGRNGSTLSAEDTRRYCPEEAITYLEVEAGEALLLHNWLVHRTGVNRTRTPWRALTACYTDGRTRNTLTGDYFPIVFGEARDDEAQWPASRSNA